MEQLAHLSSWKQTIESALAARDVDGDRDMSAAHAAFESFLEALESGECRAASHDASGHWHVSRDVKQLILYGFRLGRLVESHSHDAHFCDKHNLWPAQQSLATRGIRIVPGGTAVRRGAYIGAGVTIMAPAYVNIGAYIGRGTMIDSHVTVGSCAQVGENCHISAAAQLGGVLEPVGALPVIVEDTAFIGGNSGIYEGTHVHRGAVIATGTIITRATPIYDLVNETVIRPIDGVLHVPENAVVVPGSRAVDTPFARQNGLSLYAPIIVKYRDDKTAASVVLESILR